MKKVIFVCNYLHLDIASHNRIAELLSKKIEGYFLVLNNAEVENSNDEIQEKYKVSEELKFLDVKLKKLKNNTINEKLFALGSAIYNYCQIRNLLKKIEPDVVVIGSDLGGLNVRFLIVSVDRVKTNIIINYLCDIPPETNDWKYNLANNLLCRTNMSLTNFFRALIFKGEVVGSFDLRSHIFVASNDILNRLVDKGINKKRLSVYNSYEYLLSKKQDKPLPFDISQESHVVVFFTECIQDIYGLDYAKKLFIDILNLFSKSIESGIHFIVKPHPLEPQYMLDFMINESKRSKISFANDTDPDYLINISNVNVAHYSKVLISACMKSKLIISINFKKDTKRTFLKKLERFVLEVHSIDELDRKLIDLKENQTAIMNNFKMVAEVANRFKEGSSEALINMITR